MVCIVHPSFLKTSTNQNLNNYKRHWLSSATKLQYNLHFLALTYYCIHCYFLNYYIFQLLWRSSVWLLLRASADIILITFDGFELSTTDVGFDDAGDESVKEAETTFLRDHQPWTTMTNCCNWCTSHGTADVHGWLQTNQQFLIFSTDIPNLRIC